MLQSEYRQTVIDRDEALAEVVRLKELIKEAVSMIARLTYFAPHRGPTATQAKELMDKLDPHPPSFKIVSGGIPCKTS